MLSLYINERVNVRSEVEFRTYQANLISKDQRAISNKPDIADYMHISICIEESRDTYHAKLDSKISLEPALSSRTLHLTRSKAALASSAELCPRSAVRSWMKMPSFSFTLSH